MQTFLIVANGGYVSEPIVAPSAQAALLTYRALFHLTGSAFRPKLDEFVAEVVDVPEFLPSHYSHN